MKARPTALALYETRSSPYMGASTGPETPTADLGLRFHPDYPLEPSVDGCPGAWYRSPFVLSLAPYLRTRTSDGGRVPRRSFDQAPDQVQQAVEYFELEQDRCAAYLADERERRRRSAREREEAQRKMAAAPSTSRAYVPGRRGR